MIVLIMLLSFQRPCPIDGYVSSEYGWRSHPITGKRRFHAGMDIAAPEGIPIYAAAKGRITRARRSRDYGNVLTVTFGRGRLLYAHLLSSDVKVGDRVSPNDILGYVGQTGRTTGPHLHIEYRACRRCKAISPAHLFRCPR